MKTIDSQHRPVIVAVDGPAGSGKSTICAAVAQRLGWSYVNTGALYRAVGLLAHDRRVDLNNEKAVASLLEQVAPHMRWDHAKGQLWLGDQDLTPRLGTALAGNAASFVAKQQAVRRLLLPLQRSLTLMAKDGALVDGRDIGTVVFPDADLKIFMTASLEERARRRLRQLASGATSSSATTTLDDVMRDIAQRDEQDTARGEAPLRKADDAVEFDTSGFSQEEATSKLAQLIRTGVNKTVGV